MVVVHGGIEVIVINGDVAGVIAMNVADVDDRYDANPVGGSAGASGAAAGSAPDAVTTLPTTPAPAPLPLFSQQYIVGIQHTNPIDI